MIIFHLSAITCTIMGGTKQNKVGLSKHKGNSMENVVSISQLFFFILNMDNVCYNRIHKTSFKLKVENGRFTVVGLNYCLLSLKLFFLALLFCSIHAAWLFALLKPRVTKLWCFHCCTLPLLKPLISFMKYSQGSINSLLILTRGATFLRDGETFSCKWGIKSNQVGNQPFWG